jgi:hypothetical protein
MLKKIPAFLFVSFVVILSGCATTQGPQPIVTAAGPVATSTTTGLAGKFIAAEQASFADPSNTGLAQAMMDDGFSLLYASCSDFFLTAGTSQRWIIVARDTVGAVGTLATAVLSLHNGGKNAAANMALFTGAGFAGLDIYTKNFLFAAENVSAVRNLITTALSKHSEAAKAAGTVTYQSAMTQLIDNQEICSPMRIAALAREAIQKGDVVAAPTVDLGGITQAQDQKVLQTLGQILNPPGALNMDQAGALWWLLKDSSSATDRQKGGPIQQKLADIPPTTGPYDASGNFIAGWTNDRVSDVLDRFSKATKDSFKAAIPAARAAAATAAAAKAAGERAAVIFPAFQGAPVSAGSASTRISIGIR